MISIVIGKPGSGKTYHIVRYLYDVLIDLLKKSNVERRIYTNISVNMDEFNKQLSKHFSRPIDVSSILIPLSPEDLKYDPRRLVPEDRIEKRVAGRSFFSVAASSQAFFWNRFEDNALIVIDEIQKYLSTVKEESESEKQSLIEYFSLHRHKRHDWLFVTQNLLSIPVEVRRVSEKVLNVFNAKSMNLGFPINIPMRDIETLLAGFNVQRQIYRVREGYLESTYRVNYEDSVEVVVMDKRIFALYQTHTQLKDGATPTMFRGDSVLPFDLGPGQRRRAVFWFLKKHGFHLGVKVFFVVWFICGLIGLVNRYAKPAVSSDASNALFEDLPVEDALILTDESSDSPVSLPIDQPSAAVRSQPSMIIHNRVLILNGQEFRIGDIVGDSRIQDINPRKGVIYENPQKFYYDSFVMLRDFRDWLQSGRFSKEENE